MSGGGLSFVCGEEDGGGALGGDGGVAGDAPVVVGEVGDPVEDGLGFGVAAGVAGVADDGEEAAGFKDGGGGVEGG